MGHAMSRSISLLLALGTVATACSDTASPVTGAAVSSTASSTTTTTAPAATTSSNPTVHTVPEEEIPYPDMSGDDWDRIVSEVMTFWGWLYENPNPLLVQAASLPGSPAAERFGEVIEEYASNGWHDLPGGRAEYRSAELQTISEDGSLARVLVIDDYDGAVTVDAEGRVVKTDEDRPPGAWAWKLRMTADGWRIIEVMYLGPANWEEE